MSYSSRKQCYHALEPKLLYNSSYFKNNDQRAAYNEYDDIFSILAGVKQYSHSNYRDFLLLILVISHALFIYTIYSSYKDGRKVYLMI